MTTGRTTVDVLVAARALIEKPENWGRGMSQTRRRNQLCAGEALDRVSRGSYLGEAGDALELAMGAGIVAFNDHHNHAEVLTAFDRAIEAERSAS